MKSESIVPRSLYCVMVLQFAVGGAVAPFVSILLRDRGLNFQQISLVFLASSSTLLVFPFLWGMLADRWIPINRLFTGLNLLALGTLALFSTQRSFIGLLLTFTLFYACFNPTLTLINSLCFHHLSSPEQQFAGLRAWGSIGWILPSLPIYLWLAQVRTTQLDFVLYLGMVLTAAVIATTLALPHTPPGAKSSSKDPARARAYRPGIKRLLRNPNYVALLCSYFLMSASFSLLIFYSPPFLEDMGVARAWIGPIQCIGVVLEVFLFRWLPNFIVRWNYTNSILIGCAALMARHLLFAWGSNRWLLSASYLLAGIVIVFHHVGVSLLANAMAGLEVRATSQTLLVLFGSGLGPMFANWMAGRITSHSGNNLRPVFLFAAGLAAVAGLLILTRGSKLTDQTAG